MTILIVLALITLTLAFVFASGIAFVAVIDCLRFERVLAGREKPPSVEEIAAHAAAHPWGGDTTSGRWLVRVPTLGVPGTAECSAVIVLQAMPDGRVLCGMPNTEWLDVPPNPLGIHEPGSRWWPLTKDGALTTIPKVPS